MDMSGAPGPFHKICKKHDNSASVLFRLAAQNGEKEKQTPGRLPFLVMRAGTHPRPLPHPFLKRAASILSRGKDFAV